MQLAARSSSACPARGSRSSRCSVRTYAVVDHGSNGTRTPWYEQQKHLFVEVSDKSAMQELKADSAGKFLAVDFYAGWCACCKSAYPALCKLAADKKLADHFTFAKANIDNSEIRDLLKEEGVTGIPYVLVYDKQGRKLLAMSASFRKMDLIKRNLAALASNNGQLLMLNSDGLLVPAPQVSQEQANNN